MRPRLVLAALALFLLPAAARADTLVFGTPNSSVSFSAQPGQRVEARITQFLCTGFDRLPLFTCGDSNQWSLMAFGPTGSLVAQQTVPLNKATTLDILFTATSEGQYTIAIGGDGIPGHGLAGASWTGVVTINAPVPEPATLLPLGVGLAGVVASVHRRRKTRMAAVEQSHLRE